MCQNLQDEILVVGITTKQCSVKPRTVENVCCGCVWVMSGSLWFSVGGYFYSAWLTNKGMKIQNLPMRSVRHCWVFLYKPIGRNHIFILNQIFLLYLMSFIDCHSEVACFKKIWYSVPGGIIWETVNIKILCYCFALCRSVLSLSLTWKSAL